MNRCRQAGLILQHVGKIDEYDLGSVDVPPADARYRGAPGLGFESRGRDRGGHSGFVHLLRQLRLAQEHVAVSQGFLHEVNQDGLGPLGGSLLPSHAQRDLVRFLEADSFNVDEPVGIFLESPQRVRSEVFRDFVRPAEADFVFGQEQGHLLFERVPVPGLADPLQ